MTKTEADRLTKENDDLKRANHDMRRQVGELESRLKALEGDRHDPTGATADRVGPDRKQPADFGRATAARAATAPQGARTFTAQESLDNEALYQAFKTRLIEELPSDTRVMRIVTARPELVVEVEPKIVTLDGSNTRGRVARLIAQGWLDEPRAVAGVRQELKRTGADPGGGGTLYDSMNAFVRDGFLVRVGDQFAKAPGLKVTERELVAR